MEKDYLVLKRASASRTSGKWSEDDFDVLAEGVVVHATSNLQCEFGTGVVRHAQSTNDCFAPGGCNRPYCPQQQRSGRDRTVPLNGV
jgi:hypothetical protein